jgi:hypothetical protein
MSAVNWRKGLWRLWGVFAVAWWGFWVSAALVGIFDHHGQYTRPTRYTRGAESSFFGSQDAHDFLAVVIFLLPLLLIAGGYAAAWAMRGFKVEPPPTMKTEWEKRPPLKVR